MHRTSIGLENNRYKKCSGDLDHMRLADFAADYIYEKADLRYIQMMKKIL